MLNTILYLKAAEYIIYLLENSVTEEEKKKLDRDWKNLFRIGCILPEAIVNSEINAENQQQLYNRIHFKDIFRDGKHYLFYPGVGLFQKKYAVNMDHPLYLGYYAHLYLDKYIKRNFYGKHYASLVRNDRRELFFETNSTYVEYKKEKQTVFYDEEFRGDIEYFSSKIDLLSDEQKDSIYDSQNMLGILKNLQNWLVNIPIGKVIYCGIEEVDEYTLERVLDEEIRRYLYRYKYSISAIQNFSGKQLEGTLTECLKKYAKKIQRTAILTFNIEKKIHKCAFLFKPINILFFCPLIRNIVTFVTFIISSIFHCLFRMIRFLYQNIYSRGIIGWILHLCILILEKILHIFIRKPKLKSEKVYVNNSIYEEWKKEWMKGVSYDKEEDYFYLLFIESYDFVCSKIKLNRKKNFRMKLIYLISVLLVPILTIVIFLLNMYWISADKQVGIQKAIQSIWAGINLENVTAYGILVFILIVFARVVAKWLDIKKYQETWVRHEDHKYKLDQEMLKFVQELSPYNKPRKKLNFVENVMKIWDENQQKFVENMEEKEKGLTDMLEHVDKFLHSS